MKNKFRKTRLSAAIALLMLSFYCQPVNADVQSNDLMINGSKCGPHGSSKSTQKEYPSNLYKNRIDIPNTADIDPGTTLNEILKPGNDVNRFSQDKAADIMGYVFNVKVGGVESCNCKTNDPLFRDTHIEITPDETHTGPEYRVIIEVTPRWRQMMADLGIDWTTEALRSLKGHWVRVQGWMFYDHSHDKEDYHNDPDNNIGRNNWRSSCWEIHPVTYIEPADMESPAMSSSFYPYSEDDNDSYDGDYTPIDPNSGPIPVSHAVNKASYSSAVNATPKTPSQILAMILLGALLGLAGQGIRIAVGLKKLNDISEDKDQFNQMFDAKKLIFSILYAVTIGLVAGVLMAVDNIERDVWDKSTILALIGAGYAGADFIEGFMTRNLPADKTISKKKPAEAPAKAKAPTALYTGTPEEGEIG